MQTPLRSLTRPETLSAVVVRHIGDAIMQGEFTPGQPLPEFKLAEQLGVAQELIIRDDMPHRNLGYPTAVQLADERIHDRVLRRGRDWRDGHYRVELSHRSTPRARSQDRLNREL